MELDELTRKYNFLEGVVETKEQQLDQKINELDEINHGLTILGDAISLAKACTQEIIEQKTFLEKVISKALSEVFGIPHEFILEPIYTDGLLTGLKPKIKEGKGEEDDPMTGLGTGAQSLISLCLRICMLVLQNETAKLLVLDEPLANVNFALQTNLSEFVKNVCEETGLQVIMVTHLDSPFGRVFESVKKGGSTYSIIEER